MSPVGIWAMGTAGAKVQRWELGGQQGGEYGRRDRERGGQAARPEWEEGGKVRGLWGFREHGIVGGPDFGLVSKGSTSSEW